MRRSPERRGARRPAASVLAAGLALGGLVGGCCLGSRAPDPAPREHRLDRQGIAITLPGDYRGGTVGAHVYIFQSPRSEHVLAIGEGPAGIETSEAGIRSFLQDRVAATPEWSKPMRFGSYGGVAGGGPERARPSRRRWDGIFAGPRGNVHLGLTATSVPVATTEAFWATTCASVRAL